MKTIRSLILVGLLGSGLILTFNALRVEATNVTISENLSVTPNVISFETVFPGEVHFRPLDINLSGSFLSNPIYDDVEYRILQRPKPRIDSALERSYCSENPTDYNRCYRSLCPYLSKEADGAPANDTGVPAYHDPEATSSIALGRLAKSDTDTADHWVIDLHTPCFIGQCDQTRSVAPEYQLDPSLNGEVFGCDLVVEVTNISYSRAITRTIGFWQTHTKFTSKMFTTKLGGTLNVGTSTHVRVITNTQAHSQSRLFGAFYSSISKKTNNTNRTSLDKARMQLLQQLVGARLNCAAFGCTPATQTLLNQADVAYAGNSAAAILALVPQVDAYNNSGDAIPIPPALGSIGSATPGTSQSWANKVFWNTP
ncbi:MAG: hypothetical protein G01um101420_914 [Parcubacteria group bacterium Gr01-1014_20]|nr:MAG: hypothetical protein G01um101420_914 [Parcubacteria group bacterium Gr01-1014_20]